MKNILITGGAGFIGTNLVRRLSQIGGYTITVLDNLSPQVHGPDAKFDENLKSISCCIRGDITEVESWGKIAGEYDAVVHLAAETGTGQSMYEISRYTHTNLTGTAMLLDFCRNSPGHRVRKIILASSRAVYGEGKYLCSLCGYVYPGPRTSEAMGTGDFAMHCPRCGANAEPAATDEDSLVKPVSIYGITKATQEQMVFLFGQSTGSKIIALRFQNVFGPGQSLMNPYTGILSIFSTRILNWKWVNVFEDGKESRDFVFIDDAVEALRLVIEADDLPHDCYNVGSGNQITVIEAAQALMAEFGISVPCVITGEYRIGDIKHNFADTTRSRQELGYRARCDFLEGVRRFAEWVRGQGRIVDRYEESLEELRSARLMKASGVAFSVEGK